MQSIEELRVQLVRLEKCSYSAYKSIAGEYSDPAWQLTIDRVQGDPFAGPSWFRVRVPAEVAGFAEDLWQDEVRRVALCDAVARRFSEQAREASARRGSGKSGLLAMEKPGQEVLERSNVVCDHGAIEARLVAGLPAAGRRILGRQAAEMLCDDLPALVHQSLHAKAFDEEELRRHVEVREDAQWLREQLPQAGLVAFVAEGAILPRRSGVDSRPLPTGAQPFVVPDSLRVSFQLPNAGAVTGLGIPQGVTLIVGGGYHGKSTVLQALESGVYDHIPGDGRERVVTDASAVKIRAEDGRRVAGADLSPFINHLPGGHSTQCFFTDNASGSTSQAANIVEALEAGSRLLLIDEDTAATNFMIRDQRMQLLVASNKEPITPFLDKVRQLHTDHGVSTILVMGGCGDYFEVADTVLAMEDYRVRDVTAEARQIAVAHGSQRLAEGGPRFGSIQSRIPLPGSLDPRRGRREVSIKVLGRSVIALGEQEIDLSAVSQIAEEGQLRALAEALVRIGNRYLDGSRSLRDILKAIEEDFAHRGLDALVPIPREGLVRFRPIELAAALNRIRSLKVVQAREAAR
jgi:predicted ABC-class ATPase